MDPDYIDEPLTRMRAEYDHEQAEKRRQDRKKSGRASGAGKEVVDAEIE